MTYIVIVTNYFANPSHILTLPTITDDIVGNRHLPFPFHLLLDIIIYFSQLIVISTKPSRFQPIDIYFPIVSPHMVYAHII